MRFLVLGLFLVFSLHSDEVQRVNSIVKDITKLRVANKECKISLKSNIAKYEKLLKIKDKKIKSLENQLKHKVKKQIIIKKECENTNKFPKLSLKSQYIDKKPKSEVLRVVKAKSFHLKQDTKIYDSIDGKQIDVWERGRSFTSNKMSQNWIKITGYFVNRKWTKAKSDMWIKKIK